MFLIPETTCLDCYSKYRICLTLILLRNLVFRPRIQLRSVCQSACRVWMPVWKCLLRCAPLLRCTQLLLQLQSRCCWENQKRKSSSCWRKDPEDLNSCWNTKSFDHLQTKNWLEVFFLVIGNVEHCILHSPFNHACHQKNRFLFLFWKWLWTLFSLQFLWLKRLT